VVVGVPRRLGWLGRAQRARCGRPTGVFEGPGLAGRGLRRVAEGEQVEFDAGPVAVIVVIGSVQAGWGRRLTTMVALQGCDEQGHHDDERDDVHGSNYLLYKFMPRVAIMTSCDKFLPYWLAC
jgi:hypothetical protein